MKLAFGSGGVPAEAGGGAEVDIDREGGPAAGPLTARVGGPFGGGGVPAELG